MAKPTGVYVIVDTPNHNFTQHPDQPASTMTAYHVDLEAGETADDAVKRVAATVPPTSTLTAFKAADGTRYNFKTTLEPEAS